MFPHRWIYLKSNKFGLAQEKTRFKRTRVFSFPKISIISATPGPSWKIYSFHSPISKKSVVLGWSNEIHRENLTLSPLRIDLRVFINLLNWRPFFSAISRRKLERLSFSKFFTLVNSSQSSLIVSAKKKMPKKVKKCEGNFSRTNFEKIIFIRKTENFESTYALLVLLNLQIRWHYP